MPGITVYFTGDLSTPTIKSLVKALLKEANRIEQQAVDMDLEPFGQTVPDIDELRRVAKQLTDILRSQGQMIGQRSE